MIAHTFSFVDDIIFYIGPENIRSQRAVQKLGATLVEGQAHAHLIGEKIHDLTYRIHKANWVSRIILILLYFHFSHAYSGSY